MQRDELGRFIKGNKVAKGNKGNTKAKHGNKNALKHGLYSTHNVSKVEKDGYLRIYLSLNNIIEIPPTHYFIDSLGRTRIHDDYSAKLERMGVKLISL